MKNYKSLKFLLITDIWKLEKESNQRPTAVAAVLSIRNGGRVFLPANRRKRGLENPRSVKDHMMCSFRRVISNQTMRFDTDY
jgi:hypothetical protein